MEKNEMDPIYHEANYIMKAFRQLKLGNSLFSGSYRISNEPLSSIDMVKVVKEKLASGLAEEILKKHADAQIRVYKEDYHDRYEVQLLVLSMQDFKSVVEGAIELMPMEAIVKIKEGRVNY